MQPASIRTLLAANLHLGHHTSLMHPRAIPFIAGHRHATHIIDLSSTLTHLRRASNVLRRVAYDNGVIVFIGTRKGMERIVEDAVRDMGTFGVTRRWIPGMITNGPSVMGGMANKISHTAWQVDDHEDAVEEKKEGSEEDALKPSSKRLYLKPDILVVLNPGENKIAIKEAHRLSIPTIGIVDTDQDPRMVTYPIPGNDDSVKGVGLIMGVLSKAVKEGKGAREQWQRRHPNTKRF